MRYTIPNAVAEYFGMERLGNWIRQIGLGKRPVIPLVVVLDG